VKPSTFIPLAEQSGMIAEIGDWVLGQAMSNLGRWPGDNLEHESGISVNVSVNQLMAPNFAGSVADLLAKASVDPGLLTLEVTENVLVADENRALSVLTALKRIGVRLALDDFGSGQSSLNHIKWFPIDVVKIDREFISDIGENQASRLIVDAVVGLAHGLGMTVVAEGVETRSQLREVANLGCDFSQGYLFARPEPADALDILLSGHHTLPWSRPPELSLRPARELTLRPDLARPATISYLPPLEKWRRKPA
jgi:EAL domain-containing protein (putative c-di-GMP-specific phosphodiesterase class I)